MDYSNWSLFSLILHHFRYTLPLHTSVTHFRYTLPLYTSVSTSGTSKQFPFFPYLSRRKTKLPWTGCGWIQELAFSELNSLLYRHGTGVGVQRAGRINRGGKLGNNGEGLISVFLPEGWRENKDKSSLQYDKELLTASISLIKDRAPTIKSEYDYIDLTDSFYNENWKSSQEAEERYEEIWQELSYIYKANLSEEKSTRWRRPKSMG